MSTPDFTIPTGTTCWAVRAGKSHKQRRNWVKLTTQKPHSFMREDAGAYLPNFPEAESLHVFCVAKRCEGWDWLIVRHGDLVIWPKFGITPSYTPVFPEAK